MRYGICYLLYRFLNKSEGVIYDHHNDIYYKDPLLQLPDVKEHHCLE